MGTQILSLEVREISRGFGSHFVWCSLSVKVSRSHRKSSKLEIIHLYTMTSSNGNIFCVTGRLCGEFANPSEFHTQRPVTRSFDVFFDLRLNKRLSKQSWGWWFETLLLPLWRHRNGVGLCRVAMTWTHIFYITGPLCGKSHRGCRWVPVTNGQPSRASLLSLLYIRTNGRGAGGSECLNDHASAVYCGTFGVWVTVCPVRVTLSCHDI